MKFKVLGCAGSRGPGHFLTSYCINDNILVDAGSVCGYLDIEGQERLTHVLVSHANLDHTKDIAFLADNLVASVFHDRRGPLKILSQPSVLDSLRTHLFNDDVWPDFTRIPSPEKPTLALEPIAFGDPFRVDGLHAMAFPVPHSSGSTGYLIYGDDPEREHVAITGDSGPNGGWTDFINNAPFPVANLVVECSFPNDLENLAVVSDHLTPRLLRGMLDTLDVRPRVHVTHIKAAYASQVQEELRSELAGYRYELPRRGVVYSF